MCGTTAIGDALARHMWMRGYNVLHPMGWDAFGLPAENAALKNNSASAGVDARQYCRDEEADATDGIELRLVDRGDDLSAGLLPVEPVVLPEDVREGLAFRKKSKVNWCPECQTVLANEQVIGGRCWRHEDTVVEQRDLTQWFLRITKYADELLEGLDKLEGWPEKVRTMQRNWIGRSEGTLVDSSRRRSRPRTVTVFTTRVDTIFGATSRAVGAGTCCGEGVCAARTKRCGKRLKELLAEQQKAAGERCAGRD